MDGSNLNLSDMGTMNNGQGGMGGDKPDRTAPTGEDATAASAQPGEMGEAPTGEPGDMNFNRAIPHRKVGAIQPEVI